MTGEGKYLIIVPTKVRIPGRDVPRLEEGREDEACSAGGERELEARLASVESTEDRFRERERPRRRNLGMCMTAR
jgi:hypothetical protein